MTEEVSQSLRVLAIDADNSDTSVGSDNMTHDSSNGTAVSDQASAVADEEPYVVVLVDAHSHYVNCLRFGAIKC
jgi:hypothetical protein